MIIFLFHVVSAVLSFVVAAILAWKLILFHEQFRFYERLGMGMVGGAMILRIGPIVLTPEQTPFNDWGTTVMTAGLVLMLGGRLVRLIRHARKNELAVDAARAWKKGKA